MTRYSAHLRKDWTISGKYWRCAINSGWHTVHGHGSSACIENRLSESICQNCISCTPSPTTTPTSIPLLQLRYCFSNFDIPSPTSTSLLQLRHRFPTYPTSIPLATFGTANLQVSFGDLSRALQEKDDLLQRMMRERDDAQMKAATLETKTLIDQKQVRIYIYIFNIFSFDWSK